jgi:hypothetical protein
MDVNEIKEFLLNAFYKNQEPLQYISDFTDGVIRVKKTSKFSRWYRFCEIFENEYGVFFSLEYNVSNMRKQILEFLTENHKKNWVKIGKFFCIKRNLIPYDEKIQVKSNIFLIRMPVVRIGKAFILSKKASKIFIINTDTLEIHAEKLGSRFLYSISRGAIDINEMFNSHWFMAYDFQFAKSLEALESLWTKRATEAIIKL